MKIIYNGGIFGDEAICYHGREIVKLLDKKHTIKFNFQEVDGYWSKFYNTFKGKEEVYLMNGHVPHLKKIAEKHKKIISLCVFETTLPKDWVEALNIPEVKVIWTISEFCKELILKSGVNKPVEVIYLGVDKRFYTVKGDMFAKDKSFKFLNVSAPHCKGKQDRKGLDILVKAFKAEFGDDPNSTLILKINPIYADRYYSSIGKQFVIHEYLKSLLPDGTKMGNIAIINFMMGYPQLNLLYNSVHCGVFPARAEGFGFCQAELMKIGIPVITTDYSATNEYSDEHLRIKILGMYPLDSNAFPYFNSLFAEPDQNSLRKQMRWVYDNYIAEQKIAKNHSKTMEKFTWDKVEERMNKSLESLKVSEK